MVTRLEMFALKQYLLTTNMWNLIKTLIDYSTAKDDVN